MALILGKQSGRLGAQARPCCHVYNGRPHRKTRQKSARAAGVRQHGPAQSPGQAAMLPRP